MYEFKERVRYSETTERGVCSILALVNYLQDCSTFHSEDAGVGVEYLNRVHQAWLLSYWDIYIDRMPALCERIVIGTSPHGVRGIMACRNFWIRADRGENADEKSNADGNANTKAESGASGHPDTAGISEGNADHAAEGTGGSCGALQEPEYLVRADSLWFNFNLETEKPQKITEEMVEPYGALKDVLGLPKSSRKIALPDTLAALSPVVIQPHHIDSNHHVNNAQYIAIAADAVLEWMQNGGNAISPQEGVSDMHAVSGSADTAAVKGDAETAARDNAGGAGDANAVQDCARIFGGNAAPHRIRAEYRMAAVLGDTMLPYIGRAADGEGIVINFKNQNGETYANVEFR